MTDRRLFNDTERWILYDKAGGICQRCSRPLYGIFHADHVKPFSKGGKTEIENGQVLCGECNRMKSNSYADLPEWTMELRGWQTQAFRSYVSSDKSSFLADATPGAGKTIFALRISHHELTMGSAQKILIVTPSENLRTQWAQEAARLGIHLATDYNAMLKLSPDYHGVVTTYQTIAARYGDHYRSFKRYTDAFPTFGILDEIHHVGESLKWANAITDALGPCVRRLVITGTPFRSDRNPIPFVEYRTTTDGGQECVPDYTYGYGDALRDHVVRPVYFQTFAGEISWFNEGEIINVTTADSLPQSLASQRLRMTVDHRGDWLREVLTSADAKLMEIRKDDPAAAGLVVTKDTKHASEVAQVLKDVTGCNPIVVTSEFIEASAEIERFRYSQDKWIVAVKMVSEGVDIKRLRVGVWATNIQTELFFRQVVGRLVRMTDEPEDQYAHQYIPELEPLTTFAAQMKKERAHVIDDLDAITDELERDGDEEHIDRTFATFVSSTGEESTLIHDADLYTTQEQSLARQELRSCDVAATDSNIVVAMRLLRRWSPPVASTPQERPAMPKSNGKAPQTLEDRKKSLRAILSRMLRPIIEASNGILGYDDIHRQLNHGLSVSRIEECTYEQLLMRRDALGAWLEAWNNGTGRQFTVKGYLRERSSYVNS